MGVLWHRLDNELGRGDIAQTTTAFEPFTGNLMTDEGLISTVELSLFTDRRAPDGADLPGGPLDLRGWWGDQFWAADFDLPQFQIGSLLWLLDRSKNRAATVALVKDYAEDGVAWMIGAGILESATAVAERCAKDTIAFRLELFRPQDPDSLWTPRWEKTISGI